MAKPSDAATKLLFGTGVGMLLVAGFGLMEERMKIDEINIGWIFALLGLILLGLAQSLTKENGPLSAVFSHETPSELAVRVKDDINTSIKDASVGSAWAVLEANILEVELSEEE
ncbi:MAG: hypothetical protein QNL85_06275 [Euryarchaeota archaeon]